MLITETSSSEKHIYIHGIEENVTQLEVTKRRGEEGKKKNQNKRY